MKELRECFSPVFSIRARRYRRRCKICRRVADNPPFIDCFPERVNVMFRSTRTYYAWVSFVVIAAVVLSTAPATAELILYKDTFSRGTSDEPLVLPSSVPEVVVADYGVPADATWKGNTFWRTDGSVVNGNAPTAAGYGSCVGLPFVPQNGHVYTFSATVNCTASYSSTEWIGMGFTTNMDTNYVNLQTLGTYGWALFRLSTSQYENQAFKGAGTVSGLLVRHDRRGDRRADPLVRCVDEGIPTLERAVDVGR